jgi:NAD(P)-dependent dehydrogenase (short-subunit alcohol dehydrogenase family)
MSHNDTSSPTVLITGASTGIGAACAIELARRGFHVFAGVRSDESAQKLLDLAGADMAPKITPIMLDVTDAESIAAAADQASEWVGESGLAGLVNNAGIAVAGPLELLPIDNIRKQFEVNVMGAVAVTQAVLPLLRIARGRIVNISSVSGGIASAYLGPYCASKFAIEALTDAMRQELRTWGIRVSAVEPGPIDTPIWAKTESMADNMSSSLSPERLALYQADLEIFRKTVYKSVLAASPVERVVAAVVHALTARRPKTRYFLGWSVRACFKCVKMLSDRVRDRIVLKAIGLR